MNIFSKPMNYRQYVTYLIPSILTMIFLSFYTTIDGFFVSRYANSNALAGINIVIPITCIIFGVSVMVATGSGAIIGEYMGAKETKRANQVFTFSAIALLVLSILFTIVGVCFLKPIAILLGTSEQLMPYVLPYLFVVLVGAIPMSFKLFFEYLVRTDGSSQVGLVMSFIGLVFNIVLDYIFVGIFGLATLGAAIGTVLSITISAVIGFIYFYKHSTLRFVRPVHDFPMFWRACANGCSEMLTELSTGITTFLFNIIVMGIYGEDGVAAVTIIMYIYYFFVAFYLGIGVATAPIISYNLGSQNIPKIKKVLKYSFATIILTAICIMTYLHFESSTIIGIFIQEGHVFDITKDALYYFSPLFIFVGVNIFLSSYFTAIGDGLSSAIISTLRTLIFVIMFILVLPKYFGVTGIWLTMPMAELCTIFIAYHLYRTKGLRLKRNM